MIRLFLFQPRPPEKPEDIQLRREKNKIAAKKCREKKRIVREEYRKVSFFMFFRKSFGKFCIYCPALRSNGTAPVTMAPVTMARVTIIICASDDH